MEEQKASQRDKDYMRRLGGCPDGANAESGVAPSAIPVSPPREPKDLGAFYERAKRLGLYRFKPPTEPGS